jgi:hypothetical protein
MCDRVIDLEQEVRRMNDTTAAGALNPHALERDLNIFGGGPTSQGLKGIFQVNRWPKLYNPLAQVITPGRYVNSSADLSARAGSTAYYTSLSAFHQQGAFKYQRGYNRSTGRVNVDQTIGNDISVNLSSTFSRSIQFPAGGGGNATGLSPGTGGPESGFFFPLTRIAPMVLLDQRDHLGRLFIRTNPTLHGQQDQNPLYDYENTIGRQDADRLIGSLTARYTPLAWLGFDAAFSADRRRGTSLFFRDRGYRTTTTQEVFGGLTGNITESSNSDLGYNLMLTNRLMFDIRPDVKLNITNRYSYEDQHLGSNSAAGTDLAVPGIMTIGNAASATVVARSSRSIIRAIGAITGAQVDVKDRYIFDGLFRYDGSSLFGANERWHPYYRASFAWRASEESFWPAPRLLSDFKVRASVGTAGGRPNVSAQYETLDMIGGAPTPQTLGNEDLRPEQTIEREIGIDAELWSRIGLNVTYARAITRDQIMLVSAPAASGYPNQWSNTGTLDGKTWEVSLRIPLIQKPALSWSTQINWDRNTTDITEWLLPTTVFPVTQGNGGTGLTLFYGPGVRYGTVVGRRFARDCAELPAPFDAQCGPGKEWQTNDEGYVVWVGAGHTWQDGIKLNLWQAMRPGCLKGGVALPVNGITACEAAGGTVNAPWGLRDNHWGMPTLVRDAEANAVNANLGNTMPDFRVSMGHDVQRGRWSFHGLLDASVGNRVFNEERHWSYGDFMFRDQDQDGKSVEAAKPIGYYWRSGFPSAGVGGFYDNFVIASNRTFEDASYLKVRELSVGFSFAGLRGMCDCTVSVIGRNLFTWSPYLGWDPEVGLSGGTANSAAVAASGSFQYPQMRTFTFGLTSRF